MAIIRVQGPAKGVSATTPIAVTLTDTPIEGNLLIAVIGTAQSPPAPTVSSISQTGVTWTGGDLGLQIRSEDATYWECEIWVGLVGAGASKNISVTLTGNPDNGVVDICEYSGLLTSGFLDKTAVDNTGSNGTNTITGTTVQTTQANELCIGGVTAQGGTNDITHSAPTNGFTLLDGVGTGAGKVSLAFLEKIVTVVGTYGSGTTLFPPPDFWMGCIATFKGAPEPPASGTVLTCLWKP